MRAREGPPRQPDPPRCRRDSLTPQDRPDRRRRDVVPELEQLAADPPVTPAWVLGGEPPDQVAALGRQRRPPRTPPQRGDGPPAANQLPVPPQQRLGPDGEHGPPGARHAPTQGGEGEAVARPPGRTRPRAPENAACTTEGEELDVACRGAAGPHQTEI